MDLHSRIRQSYQNLAKDQVLMIDASQLKLWRECREKHRLSYYLGYEKAQPNIHYMFGSVVHKICEGYWAGRPYMETFHEALKLSQQLDVRKLDSKTSTKWSELCESIAPITTIYFGYHNSYGHRDIETYKPSVVLNESEFTWEWGSHAGLTVLCCGVVDRFSSSACLTDTKTASAVGKEWKTDLKKRLLREPQMGLYYRYLSDLTLHSHFKVPVKIEYEIIVKPYRGSDPRIETIDVTKEVRAYQPTFEQQLDWTIKEMCQFYAHCTDAAPWPMSNTACTTSIFGECEYLPACSGKSSLEDRNLYQIREGVTV